MTENKEFWLSLYTEEVEPLNLPADFIRPLKKSAESSSLSFKIGVLETSRLRALAQEENTTMFIVLLSVYYIMLAKLTGQEDIVIGLPVTGRDETDGESNFNPIVNKLALRNQPRGTLSYSEFLSALTSQTQLCFDHQAYPYETLVDDLKIEHESNRNPLFDLGFDYHQLDPSAVEKPGFKHSTDSRKSRLPKLDLGLSAGDADREVHLSFEYATDLFKADTIDRFITYFKIITSGIISDRGIKLSGIDLMSEVEKQQILSTFNDTSVDYPVDQTVVDLFRKQAEQTPENIALRIGEKEISYKELNDRSDKVASYLRKEYQVKVGDFVGIMLGRDEWLVPVLFGILKAGCACIPIDPKYPSNRISTIVQDSKLKVLVTRPQYRGDLKNDIGVVDLTKEADAIDSQLTWSIPDLSKDDLAYVLYTSGSTGKPKGVMIGHGALSNIVRSMQSRYPLEHDGVFLFKTALTFDVSCAELFGWFLSGGSLVLLPPEGEADPNIILQTISDYGVTHVNFSPSMFSVMLDVLETKGTGLVGSLKYLFLAGEALPASLVSRFEKLGMDAIMENVYGPTEGTIYSSGYSTAELGNRKRVPIGKPLDNVRLYIVNSQMGLLPVGVPGELCIGGVGLAMGYLHNQSLTQERFVMASFFLGERLYKTGDLARWLPDGDLEYLGRMDHQVKLRGLRIELGEIEAQLVTDERVKECVVKDYGEGAGKYLVAYYVSRIAGIEKSVKSRLSERIPKYMVPSVFIELDKMPLNNSGKIDRKYLPAPELTAGPEYVSPSNITEEKIVEIWSEVLGLPESIISADKSFYDLGGHSLSVATMLNRVHRVFNIKLSFQDFFKKRTIRLMAEHIKLSKWLTDEGDVIKSNDVTI